MIRLPQRSLALAALALAATGCVMPDEIAQLRKDVADVRAELLTVRREQNAARDTLTAVQTKVAEGGDVKRAEFADLKSRVDEMDRAVATATEHADQAQSRMDRLAQDVSRLKDGSRRPLPVDPANAGMPGMANPPAANPGPGAAPTPEALYNQSYSDFSKGNYALAAAGFDEFAGRFPDSDQADNALYWIGECHFSEARFSQAIEAFDRMLEKFPRSDRAAAANLKKG